MTSGRPLRYLPPRARALLGYIWEFRRKEGYPPTCRDLLGIDWRYNSIVYYWLRWLVLNGLAEHTPGVARGTTLTPVGILAAQGYRPLFMVLV